MLVIRTSGTGQQGSSAKPVENHIAWQIISGQKQIIAVGGPSDWAAPGPLPADAVLVDLLQASLEDPTAAKELWGRFLTYVDFKENRGAFHALKRYFAAIPVRVEIDDRKLAQAVVTAIRTCKLSRIKLHDS